MGERPSEAARALYARAPQVTLTSDGRLKACHSPYLARIARHSAIVGRVKGSRVVTQ